MNTLRHIHKKEGFALPTIMIASVVMLMVLLSGLVSASSSNSAIRDQYYQKIAQQAAEAGGAMAEACLKRNNYIPTWSTNPLRPHTDCNGTQLAGFTCPTPNGTTATPIEPRCAIVESNGVRSTFQVSALSGSGAERTYTVTSTVYVMRASSRTVASTRTVELRNSVVFKNNPAASRPSKRFWLFGSNAGLDFGTNGTVANPVNMCASGQTCVGSEGYTVIANREGTLQFWTDGRTVWNRNGNVMNNGLDSAGQPANLNANASTTQAAAVLPIGADETRYAIITNNTENGWNNLGELFYSVIDMTLDSGRGAVLAANKNVPLISGQVDYASEALTAAPKADGTGYWVVTFTPNTTRLVAVPFNNSGVVGTPVYSAAGFTPGKADANSGFGSVNFNTDYTKIVLMAGGHCISGTCPSYAGLLRTMTFDTATGVATNQFYWNNYTGAGGQGYSADWSPDGNNIYTTTLYPGRVYRYRVAGATTSNDVAISVGMGNDTAVTTSGNAGNGGGQVLRGPDNRMYVANWGSNAISVINNPDAVAVGDVGWVYNGRPLCVGGPQPCNEANNASRYGLPQMVTIYSPQTTRF